MLGAGAALIALAAALLGPWLQPDRQAPRPSQPPPPAASLPTPAPPSAAVPSAATTADPAPSAAPIPLVGGGSITDSTRIRAIRQVLALAARGPPYPHRADGTSFANRERRLPAQPRGYYREFTVPTPGEADRGARRLVIGRGGDCWYTDDHYRTFVRLDVAPVVPGEVPSR